MKSSSLVSIGFCSYTKMFSANDLQHELVYCLAFVKSAELNIIGRKSSLKAMLVGRTIYYGVHLPWKVYPRSHFFFLHMGLLCVCYMESGNLVEAYLTLILVASISEL